MFKGTAVREIWLRNIQEHNREFLRGSGDVAKTQETPGKLLPVVITVYKDKSFDFIIKTPPAASQLLESAKIKKGSAIPNMTKVGTVTWDQVREIAENKLPDLNTNKVESAMRQIAGTAQSMGMRIKGLAPWEN